MFKRLENENEEQFLWRIGQAKDNGVLDCSWDEIADVMNKEFREDVSEYRTAAAYRKPYQQAKRFHEAGIFNDITQESYISALNEAKEELRKEKQKLSDERSALNKKLRESARAEEDYAILADMIQKNGRTTLPFVECNNQKSDNDMIIALSDFHLGIDTNNYFGTYNPEIAAAMLSEYLTRILQIRELHNSENAYVFLMGDLISGAIHFTTQLENRENVTEQIQTAAELISAFVYELSKHFRCVYVNWVAGNHSRMGYKDQVIRDERLDNLIPWYMEAKLAHIDNITVTDMLNYDSTIGRNVVRGKEYWFVHGDFDSFSENGVSKLVMMIGRKPEAIFYGHLHRCSYDDIAGVKIIRSGSFVGTTDDFTISKRLSGRPSQMVCVADADGVVACYPVELGKIKNREEFKK